MRFPSITFPPNAFSVSCCGQDIAATPLSLLQIAEVRLLTDLFYQAPPPPSHLSPLPSELLPILRLVSLAGKAPFLFLSRGLLIPSDPNMHPSIPRGHYCPLKGPFLNATSVTPFCKPPFPSLCFLLNFSNCFFFYLLPRSSLKSSLFFLDALRLRCFRFSPLCFFFSSAAEYTPGMIWLPYKLLTSLK